MLSGNVAAGCESVVGIESENPAVNITPAASPIARPTDNKVAVAIPGAICLRTTPIVSNLVAPSEYEASNKSRGKFFATSSIERIKIGIINNVITIIPPKSDVLIPK